MILKEIRDRTGLLRGYSDNDGLIHKISSIYKTNSLGEPTQDLIDGIEIVPMTEAEVQEIQVRAQAIEAEQAATQYKQDRAKEYPDFRDYLDGIVKGDQAQIDAYIAACQAVKAKYPKE